MRRKRKRERKGRIITQYCILFIWGKRIFDHDQAFLLISHPQNIDRKRQLFSYSKLLPSRCFFLGTTNSNVNQFWYTYQGVHLKYCIAYALSDLCTYSSKKKKKKERKKERKEKKRKSLKWHCKAHFSMRDYPQMETSWLYYLTTISFLIYINPALKYGIFYSSGLE